MDVPFAPAEYIPTPLNIQYCLLVVHEILYGSFMPSLPVWLSVGYQSCRKPRDCSTALLWCGKGESLGEDLCLGVSETAQWAQVPACRPDDSSLILASHMVAGKK